MGSSIVEWNYSLLDRRHLLIPFISDLSVESESPPEKHLVRPVPARYSVSPAQTQKGNHGIRRCHHINSPNHLILPIFFYKKTDRRQIPHNPLHLISGNLVINHLLYGSMMRRRNSTITLDKHHISAHYHPESSFTTDHCTLHPSVYLEGPPNSFRNQLRIHPTMRMDSLATLCSYSNTVAHVNHPTFKPFKFSILTSNLLLIDLHMPYATLAHSHHTPYPILSLWLPKLSHQPHKFPHSTSSPQPYSNSQTLEFNFNSRIALLPLNRRPY